MIRQFVLTVAESKRLIARAVAGMEVLQRAKREGMLVIATGTTNSYVAEEVLGRSFDKRAYLSGLTLPKNPDRAPEPRPQQMPDLVFRRGELVPDLDRFTAVPHLQAGDVYIKGANALDYRNKTVGILIGGDSSGTIGRALGTIIGRRVHLIVPVGLEKLVYEDISGIARKLLSPDCTGDRLFPVTVATIVTEIEALKMQCGVEALLVAAGGIAGAEGCVRLAVEGDAEQVERARTLHREIQGEPRFLI